MACCPEAMAKKSSKKAKKRDKKRKHGIADALKTMGTVAAVFAIGVAGAVSASTVTAFAKKTLTAGKERLMSLLPATHGWAGMNGRSHGILDEVGRSHP